MSLAVVRDLREARAPAGPGELAAFETDVLAGFVLARAAAGLSDNTIRSDVLHLEQGARGSGPRERMVPLINGAGATLRWFIQDVWSCFDDDHARPGAPLFCSERRNTDGSAARVGNETLRSDLAAAAAEHLPDWRERVTPHVLRHFCASQLYLGGMDLVAIQETLGHAWVATTMNYIHEPSGIASAGRETAGQQVTVAPE